MRCSAWLLGAAGAGGAGAGARRRPAAEARGAGRHQLVPQHRVAGLDGRLAVLAWAPSCRDGRRRGGCVPGDGGAGGCGGGGGALKGQEGCGVCHRLVDDGIELVLPLGEIVAKLAPLEGA
eukprot:scaffold37006_cov63-Phaeocystis_antarctica.AAC.1